jgi:multiple sugar transport system substrate-binding protein
MYRKDIFESHGITPPPTWDEFAETAVKLHRDSPDVFLTDMQLNAGAWFTSLAWQAGSRPFLVEGTTVTIRINDEPAKRVAAFWQKMIDAHAVDTAPASTAEWYQSTDQGRYASWIAAAWAPLFLSQFAHASFGQWRVAPIPQWSEGAPVSANFGGSTSAATTQTKHPKEAATLAIWLGHDPALIEHRVQAHYAFPTVAKVLDSASFQDRQFPFYGDQPINKVFVQSGREVDGSFQWSPFQDYVFAQMGNEMSSAGAGGNGTLVQALDRVQRNVVAFAKGQGFTVRT